MCVSHLVSEKTPLQQILSNVSANQGNATNANDKRNSTTTSALFLPIKAMLLVQMTRGIALQVPGRHCTARRRMRLTINTNTKVLPPAPSQAYTEKSKVSKDKNSCAMHNFRAVN
jgi:hypothetical protein